MAHRARFGGLCALLGALLLVACSTPVPAQPTVAPASTATAAAIARPTPTFRPAVPPTVLAPQPTDAPDPGERAFADAEVVQVFVASSIGVAMQQVAMGFLTANPSSARVQLFFDTSERLVGRIRAGTPADVLAWDNPSVEATLRSADLLDGEPRVFARGNLVMVVPAGNPKGLTGLADLAGPGARWAAARPETLLGAATMKLLDAASALPEYGPTFRATAERNIQLRAENAAEVLERVAEKGADAGIVHAGDIPLDLAKLLTVLPVPDALAVGDDYSVGVIKRGPNAQAARTFVAYLGSPAAQAILAKYGFVPPPVALTPIASSAEPPASATYSPAVDVRGLVESPRRFTRADLAQLPQETLRGPDGALYEGTQLLNVFNAAGGAHLPNDVNNAKLRVTVTVTSADGTSVVLSWGALDPDFGAMSVLVATSRDGAPLVDGQGMARLVVPGDRLSDRSVKSIARIELSDPGPPHN